MTEILSTEKSLQDLEQIGRKFRKQRKKKSLSIQEVSETLCIGEKILNGIEEGNVEEKIAPVFMRGFIRSYAKHLDLWDEALEQSVSESSGLEKDRINKAFPKKKSFGHRKSFHPQSCSGSGSGRSRLSPVCSVSGSGSRHGGSPGR